VISTFTVTTTAGFPAATTLSVAGQLPPGIAFHSGTASFDGIPTMVGDYPLALAASNGTGSDGTQSFVLHVIAASAVVLPPVLPTSDGTLGGVPQTTLIGQVLHVTGTGFAAGAPVTLGLYSMPTSLGNAVADADGNFAATVALPNLTGEHTVVAAGITPTGNPQFLQKATVVSARAVPSPTPSPSSTSGAGALANTGLWPGMVSALESAVLLVLLGGGLTMATRRRRRH
jgi:hypothetical protein